MATKLPLDMNAAAAGALAHVKMTIARGVNVTTPCRDALLYLSGWTQDKEPELSELLQQLADLEKRS